MYLHITLFATLLFSAILVTAHSGQLTIAIQTDDRNEIVEQGELIDPCYLDVVECEWKFTAPVTKYIDKGTMASGRQTYVGAIACPRFYKLGQKVEVNGVEYTCEDRTNKRLDGRFDIFTDESYEDAMSWGRKELIVTIK